MSQQPLPPKEPNLLGSASLALGVASTALVFGIGLCALVGAQQGWLALAGTLLFVCGASSAFLGFIAVGLGAGGLFGANRQRSGAAAGLVFGLIGLCLFLVIMAQFGG